MTDLDRPKADDDGQRAVFAEMLSLAQEAVRSERMTAKDRIAADERMYSAGLEYDDRAAKRDHDLRLTRLRYGLLVSIALMVFVGWLATHDHIREAMELVGATITFASGIAIGRALPRDVAADE